MNTEPRKYLTQFMRLAGDNRAPDPFGNSTAHCEAMTIFQSIAIKHAVKQIDIRNSKDGVEMSRDDVWLEALGSVRLTEVGDFDLLNMSLSWIAHYDLKLRPVVGCDSLLDAKSMAESYLRKEDESHFVVRRLPDVGGDIPQMKVEYRLEESEPLFRGGVLNLDLFTGEQLGIIDHAIRHASVYGQEDPANPSDGILTLRSFIDEAIANIGIINEETLGIPRLRLWLEGRMLEGWMSGQGWLVDYRPPCFEEMKAS